MKFLSKCVCKGKKKRIPPSLLLFLLGRLDHPGPDLLFFIVACRPVSFAAVGVKVLRQTSSLLMANPFSFFWVYVERTDSS